MQPATVLGTCRFVGLDGLPMKRRLVIASDGSPFITGGYWAGQELQMVVDSDLTGLLQVNLIPGVVVRIGIEGTTYVREITVPNANFDILAAMATAPDPFTVQGVPPLLVRSSF